MHQEDEMPDEVTLSKHHYPDHLIETGLVMFSKRPTLIMKTDSGDTKLSFPGTGDGSRSSPTISSLSDSR